MTFQKTLALLKVIPNKNSIDRPEKSLVQEETLIEVNENPNNLNIEKIANDSAPIASPEASSSISLSNSSGYKLAQDDGENVREKLVSSSHEI